MTHPSVLTAYVERGGDGSPSRISTGLARLAFCSDGAPSLTTDGTLGVFVVHLLRNLVPADDQQIDEVIALGDLSDRTDAAGPMLDQLRSAYFEPSGGLIQPFDLEPAWARTFGTIIARVTGVTPSTTAVANARLAQIERIVQRFSSDRRLTPVSLASAIRVSRRTLYDLTATSMGGISEYIRTARVNNAISMLADPQYDSLTMSQIAARAGFSSSKHLSRALAVLFDTSASAVRRERFHPHPVRADHARSEVT